MKFLLEKQLPISRIYDFSLTLLKAKEYYKWAGEEMKIHIRDTKVFEVLIAPDTYIPVGSIEFVSTFLRRFYPEAEKALRPLNVPEKLFPFAGRKIANINIREDFKVFRDCNDVFIKSNEKIKDEFNGPKFDVWNYYESKDFVKYQVSEIIDLKSEWRVIVFHGQIQYVANYAGDCTVFPDIETIKAMIKAYGDNAPVAYTLDVGVSDNETVVVECHRFFSCGLYGYNDLQKYPKMLSQEWFEMKNIR